LAKFAPEFQPQMASLLNPAEGMKTRELPGGTGPVSVGMALERAAAVLDKLSAESVGQLRQ
jgi:hypothetical protein